MARKNQTEEEIADLYEIKQRYLKFVNRSSVDNYRNNYLKENHFMNR